MPLLCCSLMTLWKIWLQVDPSSRKAVTFSITSRACGAAGEGDAARLPADAMQPDPDDCPANDLRGSGSVSGGRPSGLNAASNPLLRRLLDPDYSFSNQSSGDLSSASPSVRRPRRFEIEGGDRSSFLFRDEEERCVYHPRHRT